MQLTHIPAMLFSPSLGWTALKLAHPSPLQLLGRVFVPFALLPPAMLLLAAHGFGSQVLPNAGPASWLLMAAALLVVEFAALPVTTWLIIAAARAHGGRPAADRAFALAVLTPIPLWLASGAAPLDHPGLLFAAALVGTAASTALLRQGVRALLAVHDPDEAGHTAFTVLCACALLWSPVIATMTLWG